MLKYYAILIRYLRLSYFLSTTGLFHYALYLKTRYSAQLNKESLRAEYTKTLAELENFH